MRFVEVSENGMCISNVVRHKGEVIEGKVKLKPGFNQFNFDDLKPVEFYVPHPGTAAWARGIKEITEEEFRSR